MSYVPGILGEAAKEDDPIRQFQYVIGFLGASTNHLMMAKQPINPILGETLSGWIGDAKIDVEQISHHPPISALIIESDEYRLQGDFMLRPWLGLPHIHFMVYGQMKVIFKRTKNEYMFTSPFIRVKGVITGQRKFIIEGKKINKKILKIDIFQLLRILKSLIFSYFCRLFWPLESY